MHSRTATFGLSEVELRKSRCGLVLSTRGRKTLKHLASGEK